MKKWIPLFILLIILGGIGYASTFQVTNVHVVGCSAVNPADVEAKVREAAPLNNTLLLYLRNKIKAMEDIPFVSKLEINFIDKNTIEVTVYEKSMAGCIQSMDSYVYFDKDGIVLDASTQLVPGVPIIKGLTVTEWEMDKKLPVDDKGRFQTILTITQLVDKYDLTIDGIQFTDSNEIELTYKAITIELGEGEYLAVQMMNLGNILEKLEGMSGTLYMKDFSTENGTASFRAN